eukprot:GHVO01001515.1.p2 GENE.GHVO01001515.1~~GHVO01001515.1.p2  ORF type:complete len:137 (+),score=21.24 GHVO01001515.1:833-1243(+)
MYLIGDSLDSDIVGCNLYQKYIDRIVKRRNNNIDDHSEQKNSDDSYNPSLQESRNIPIGTTVTEQTVSTCMGILVCTGVYKPETCPEPGTDGGEEKYPGHRDFDRNMELYKPEVTLNDVDNAIDYIFEQEGHVKAV